MAATKPEPTQPRPTSGTYAAPSGANPPAPDQWGQSPSIDRSTMPHSAFDELEGWDAGASSTLGDGAHESTLD
jgi:hypothetical protein